MGNDDMKTEALAIHAERRILLIRGMKVNVES